MNKELKKILDEHYDKVVGLLKKAAEQNNTPYKSGVVDGVEHAIPGAFSAGVRGLRSAAVKKIGECCTPNTTIFAISEADKKALWLRINENGEAYDMNGNHVFLDNFDYCINLPLLLGKEVSE